MSDSIRNILYMGHNIALLEALFDPADKSGEYGSVTHLINSENLYSTLAEKNYNQLISEIPLNNDLIAKITRDFPFLKTTYLMPPDASKSIDYYQENALSDKERLMLRAAADLSTDLVYFKDLESRFLSCNKNFEKFMGCPEQEIVGKTDESFFTKELALRCQEQDRKVMLNKQIYAEKDYRTSHDGESHFLDIKKAPLLDKQGKVQGLIGVARDITAYHLLQKRLQITDTVFENSKENLLVTDEAGIIIAVNKACCNATGFSKEELLQSDMHIFSGSQYESIRTAMKKRNNWQGDFKYRTKNGETHFGWGEVACVEHPEKGSFSYISSWLDLNQSQNVERKIQYLSKYDPLTGAFNRIALFNRLEGTISRAIFNQLTMAVILVDINGFMAINEQYGHHAGDAVLLEIAERFKRCVFEKDTVARFGDDEFVIIVDELANEQDVADVAHNIAAQFDRNFEVDGLSVHLSATIGIALCPDDGTDVDTLINNAEKAMLRGKSYYNKAQRSDTQPAPEPQLKGGRHAGKATAYHFYTKRLTHHSRQQAKFAAQLAEALQQDQFELYYQPQYDLSKRQVVAVEAVLCWNHPQRGPLHSDSFSSLAEQKGLAVPIGLMMIRKAALQAVIWQSAAINFGRIAISLAEVHLAQFSLIADLHTILLESRCSIAWLEFAIDEVIFTSDNPVVHENLINLSKMGVALTIDKFGEERPLFRLFEQLTIDKFKISKHFSEGAYVDFINRAIQDGVLVLARSLGVTVVSDSLGNKTGGGVGLSTRFSPTGQQLHSAALKASEITFYLHCNKRK